MAQYHENFNPFSRIALPNDRRTLHCRSLASRQRLSIDHGVDSPVSVTAWAARQPPCTARVYESTAWRPAADRCFKDFAKPSDLCIRTQFRHPWQLSEWPTPGWINAHRAAPAL
jgi:hypothetical protein